MINFGNGYSVVESTKVLEVGDYECQIVDIQLDHYNNGNQFLKVVFSVDGNKDIQPNCTILNDRPVLNDLKANGQPITDEDLKKWDKSMTKFFDCFGITRGDFNFKNWQFKKGVCHCDWQYDKNEPDKKSKLYKQFTPKIVSTVAMNSVVTPSAVPSSTPADTGTTEENAFNPFM